MTNWHWPQYTMAAVLILRVIIHMAKHGELRDAALWRYNGGYALSAGLITGAILWAGGFWP